MAKEQLWTDNDVREAFKTYGRAEAKKMRDAYEARIAELEAQVIEWKAVVGRLRETERWLPLENRETIGDERWPQTVWVVIGEHGFSFCTPYSTDHIRLPEGYALCRKVQP